MIEKRLRLMRCDLVLDRDMRTEALFVVRRQPICKVIGEPSPQRQQRFGLNAVSNAPAKFY